MAVALTLLLAAALSGCARYGADEFIEEWATKLSQLAHPADTQGLPSSQWSDGVWVRRFDSGEWIAVRATDPKDSHDANYGYEATVFCDSNGLVQIDTETHVCSFDFLDADLGEGAIEAVDLDNFYAAMRARSWVLTER